ncbi:MAG: hypothetical protein JKY36_06505 [Erythrobacter sp.]|nr:hypothetical protein [Erythrobacter sp.]
MKNDIEPLEPNLWFNRIEKLLDRSSSFESEDPGALVRQAMHVAQLTPRPLRDTVRFSSEEVTIEEMLECGAFLSAMAALLSPPVTYTLTRRGVGKYVAAVSCPDSRCRGQGESNSAEKALLTGWCQFLLDLKRQSQFAFNQSLHISQSAQHQQLTEH